MFDGLSLVASLLTIGEAVAEAIKYVRTLCRASEELEALQEHVQNYAMVIQGVERRQNLSPTVVAVLSQARSNLNELEELIDGKVSRKENNRSQVRRRAWAKYRSQLHQTQSSLMGYNATLLTAIVNDSSISGARAEATLGCISRAIGDNPNDCTHGNASNSVHGCLSDIQDSQDAMLYQINTISSFLCGRIAHCSMPTTVLETSQHFFPERYTLESQIPSACLLVYEAYEQQSGADVTTNLYRVLYQQSPRQWRWLIIYIDIHRRSTYWAATKISQVLRKWSNPVLGKAALIPHSLLTQVSTLLYEGKIDHESRPVRLSLTDKNVTFEQNPPGKCLDISLRISTPRNQSLDAVNHVHDLGCPQYVESQVFQLEIIDQPSRLRSCVNGILVLEVKCMDAFPSAEFLYCIRVLHCMKGASGFAKLVGVVTDDERTEVKSYLIDFPKARDNIMHLAGDPSISWERREKWAFQVIQSLTQMHEQGFVLGGITIFSVPLILNSTDSIFFWIFRERIVPGRTVGAYYPPELLNLRDMSPAIDEADRILVTSKMDIFHLGILLWLLAERKPITRASPVCMRRGCVSLGEIGCDLTHVEPIALPDLPESVPRYYRDIVNSCRAEKPGDRPAARDLLQKFPNVGNTLYENDIQTPTKDSEYITSGVGLQVSNVACSLCQKRPNHQQLPIFHCNVCHVGDFDLCEACFERGAHCYNDDHLLVELGKIGSWILPRRYHSCVKSSGYREVIDL